MAQLCGWLDTSLSAYQFSVFGHCYFRLSHQLFIVRILFFIFDTGLGHYFVLFGSNKALLAAITRLQIVNQGLDFYMLQKNLQMQCNFVGTCRQELRLCRCRSKHCYGCALPTGWAALAQIGNGKYLRLQPPTSTPGSSLAPPPTETRP